MKNTIKVALFALLVIIGLLYIQQLINESVFGVTSIIFSLTASFIVFVIFLENRRPAHTLTWIVVLGSFPLFGFFFYLMFGRNYRKRKMFDKKALIDEAIYLRAKSDREHAVEQFSVFKEHQQQVYRLAKKMAKTPISFATDTRVLTNGIETFDTIFAAIEAAEHHIHLEYYIVRDDALGRRLRDLLVEKANEGVVVRFLYDDVGSLQLGDEYIDSLKRAGVEVVPFLPVRLAFLNSKINYRNHRKIVVVDGKVGFVGGLNVGDEYIGKDPSFGFWRDTHLSVVGEGVGTLQLIFMRDWFHMTGETLLMEDYMPIERHELTKGGVQLIAGGPDQRWEVIKTLFFAMITSASESIWIASPYFIPDDEIFAALKVAALSGLDVRLVVPKNPDKKIVFHASRSYFPELLEAGVKIYQYKTGFLHSKVIVVDGEIASIGTANMDMRSFHLNFEVNAFLYHTESVGELVEDFHDDFAASELLDKTAFLQRSMLTRTIESLARLFSPLL